MNSLVSLPNEAEIEEYLDGLEEDYQRLGMELLVERNRDLSQLELGQVIYQLDRANNIIERGYRNAQLRRDMVNGLKFRRTSVYRHFYLSDRKRKRG
jgi:hypothetical protein